MPHVQRVQAGTNSRGRPIWRYRGRYRNAAGRKQSRTFDTESAALRWAGEEEAKVHRGARTDPAGARMPWGQWCDRWHPAKRLEPSTRTSQESRIRVHVRPRWGPVPLIDITRLDVQTWVNELDGVMSASMVRQCYRILSNSMATAVAEGILAANPCVKITLPVESNDDERFLDAPESAALLDNLDSRYRVLAELLLGTGLRISEACGLHAARVDLRARRIDVVEVYDADRRQVRGYPKSKRRRSVPISHDLAVLLSSWLAQHPPARRCGRPHRGGVGDRCPSGLLVTGPRGAPIDPHNFEQRQWRTAAIAAGLAENEGTAEAPRWRLTATPHDLRHTYASTLVRDGVPIERVQLLLGHESLAVTQRYAKYADGHGWDEVRAALDGARARRAEGAAEGAEQRSQVTAADIGRNHLKAL